MTWSNRAVWLPAVFLLQVSCMAPALTAQPRVIKNAHSDYINWLAVSPDGKILASAGFDHKIHLWSLATGNRVQSLLAHTTPVNVVKFSPDGDLLASGAYSSSRGTKNVGIVWEVKTGKQRFTVPSIDARDINNLCFSPDGKLLVTGGEDYTLRFLNVASGVEQKEQRMGVVKPLQLDFLPGGKTLAVGCWKLSLLVDVKSKKVLRRFAHPAARMLAISPTGNLLASGGESVKLELWSTATGKVVRTLTMQHSGWVRAAFSPGGKMLAAVSQKVKSSSVVGNGVLQIWDTSNGQLVHQFQGHTGSIDAVAFTPCGTRCITAGDDYTIRIWDLTN